MNTQQSTQRDDTEKCATKNNVENGKHAIDVAQIGSMSETTSIDLWKIAWKKVETGR